MVVRYGEGGIRTPDKAFRPYNGLANRRLQPLGHLSTLWPNNLAARRFLWKGGDRHAVHCHPGRPMSVYESTHPLTRMGRMHLANLGDTMDALLRVCSISGEILGTPSAVLGKALEGADVHVSATYQSM